MDSCVKVQVRVFVCVYACMYVFVYVCMYAYVCIYVRMYVCVLCMYVRTYVMYVCTCVGMYVCAYVCVCIYVCVYVRMCVLCMYYVRRYVCMHAYGYVYSHICTYVLIYMYVCMYAVYVYMSYETLKSRCTVCNNSRTFKRFSVKFNVSRCRQIAVFVKTKQKSPILHVKTTTCVCAHLWPVHLSRYSYDFRVNLVHTNKHLRITSGVRGFPYMSISFVCFLSAHLSSHFTCSASNCMAQMQVDVTGLSIACVIRYRIS